MSNPGKRKEVASTDELIAESIRAADSLAAMLKRCMEVVARDMERDAARLVEMARELREWE